MEEGNVGANSTTSRAPPPKIEPGEPVVLVNYDAGSKGSDGEADPQVQVSVISAGGQKQDEVRVVSEANGDLGARNVSVDDLEKLARQRKPLWYCKMITTHPKAAFGITLCLHILMLLITLVLVQVGYDIVPFEVAQLPLDIRDDDDYLRGLAWQQRTETDDIIDRNAVGNAFQLERSVQGDRVELFFEMPSGNVFTKKHLQLMEEVEDKFFFNEKYQKSFCQLTKNPDPTLRECIKPSSVLRYFDGTFKDINPIFNDPLYNNVNEVLFTAETDSTTSKVLQSFLGKDAVLNETLVTSEITFSRLFVGLPLKGYDNETHEEDEQVGKIEDFMIDEFQGLGKDYFKDGVGDMDFFYFSRLMFIAEIVAQAIRDMALSGGSMLFITVFMCFQTGSLWISLFAIFSILCGFATTNLIYRVVLDFRFFGTFHILAIFIILGIGADDIFIMFDTWKETAHYEFPSLAHRMSYVYRRAAFAMLFTSLTTAVAFIVSAFSPFLGIYTFGAFSGILVAVNYLSVIIFFPTVMITYHLYWDKYRCCCCCQRSQTTPKPTEPKRRNPIVRFFAGPYFRVVSHKVGKWIILCCYIGLISCFIYFTTKLEVDEDQPKFLKEDTNFGKYLAKSATAFRPANLDSSTRVLLVWGMKNQDIGGCHHTEVECFGDNVWADDFDLNSDEAQLSLMGLCDKIRRLPDDKLHQLRIRSDLLSGVPEVQCFLDEIDTFLKTSIENETQVAVPTGQANAEAIQTLHTPTQDNTLIYNVSALGEGFYRYFEVAMSYWLYGGFSFLTSGEIGGQYFLYDSYLGESEDPPHTVAVDLGARYKYHYGTRLRYAAISVNTTIESEGLGYEEGLKIRDAWEDFLNNELKNMSTSLQSGFQLSAAGFRDFNLWHWLKVQRKLVSSAVVGMGVGVAFALPILIIATQNVVTGLIATGVILVITVSVIGLIPMAGWKLGLLESLNLVLVVGLSVDYVVHLAEGYSRSAHPDRLGRLHDTLKEVGISVLSGAVTTLGASMLLVFAEIIFFTQFGLFMFGTIGFSILYALGLFTTVMGLIGPENDFGSLRPLFRKCCPNKQ